MSDSLDRFKVFKDFIKKSILENSDLQKLIYYPSSDCLSMDDLENPFLLFDETDNTHGIILFKQKNNTILNNSIPIVLVNFETTKKTKELDTVYIIIRIIIKNSDIDNIDNGISRSYAIAKLIDDELNLASITGLGEVSKSSFEQLSLNEENIGYTLIYKAFDFNSDWSSNKNFKKRILGQ